MDSKIKNVIFDLGGVLINLDFDSCLNAFRTAGFTNIEEQVRQMQGNGVFSDSSWEKSHPKSSGMPSAKKPTNR